jgi:hypothetical protein
LSTSLVLASPQSLENVLHSARQNFSTHSTFEKQKDKATWFLFLGAAFFTFLKITQ